MGFVRCVSDAEMFTLSRSGQQVILLKHVDDCLLAATRESDLLEYVSSESRKSYSITTSVEPTNFVGFAISSNYILNKNNNAPTRPPARLRRINMLIAKRNINISSSMR